MEFLIRLVQIHETFRLPELEALATLNSFELSVVHYDPKSPFCIVRLASENQARALIQRSILSHAIYELWGQGRDYETLQNNLGPRDHNKDASFRFMVDSFQGKLNTQQQRDLIESFSFLDFKGPIKMKNADQEFCIFENYDMHATSPKHVYFGRLVARSGRDAIVKYDLKKRSYISRTSMDAELSLVTANMILAAPGKLVFDPFVGTGSFIITSAHFGAATMGSDIDGRSIRGTPDKNQTSNFHQYGLTSNIDCFISDLTHTPLRLHRIFDAIICDPPYGIREGPKVLGSRVPKSEVIIDGRPAHLQDGYIPPKRAYNFEDMLSDVLDFSALTLIDKGRLAMWMPLADDEDIELSIPRHPALVLVCVSVQAFNKWSRRLLTYSRLPDHQVNGLWPIRLKSNTNATADELNRFRKKYFQGFKPEATTCPSIDHPDLPLKAQAPPVEPSE